MGIIVNKLSTTVDGGDNIYGLSQGVQSVT